MKIFVKTLTGKTNTLDVEASDTIDNIQKESTLHLILRLRGGMFHCTSGAPSVWSDGEIFIRTLTGKTLTIAASSTDTIGAVKRKIEDKEGVPPEAQRLIFAGGRLEDDNTLGEYKFYGRETLYLILRLPRWPEGKHAVHVVSHVCGNTFTFEVESMDTIDHLKSLIAEAAGIDADCQRLVFAGRQLEGSTMLGFHCQPNDTLHLMQRLRPVFSGPPCAWSDGEVYIKRLTGKTVTIAASSTDSIEAIKAKIAEKEGIAPEQQRLVCKGTPLEDGKTLGDYHCHCQDTLYVVERLRHIMPNPTSCREGFPDVD